MNILYLLNPKSTVSYLLDNNTVRQGLEKMRSHGFTATPVLSEDGKYVGTISEGDFLWQIVDHRDGNLKHLEEFKIRDIIRKEWNRPVKVSETMENLLLLVKDQNFVPVVDDRNFFMGIITRKDVITYIHDELQKQKNGGEK